MNNDLNAIISAKVVKLKVQLDAKGSKLPSQVNAISTLLKEKKVKLRVTLTMTQKEVNSELGRIRSLLAGAKPITVRMALDTKGTAGLQSTLNNVTKSMNTFNKNYETQARKMTASKQKIEKAMTITNVPTSASVSNFNNIKNYAKQMQELERIMRSKIPNGINGVFSSTALKDAQGNMTALIGTMKRADGVIDTMRMKWNANSGKFSPISSTTVVNTQRNAEKVRAAIYRLEQAKLRDWEVTKSMNRRNAFDNLIRGVKDTTISIQTATFEAKKMDDQLKSAISRATLVRKTPIGGAVSGSPQANQVLNMFNNDDMAGIQRYIERAKGVGVQSMVARDRTHRFGQSITELKVKMAGTGKQVEVLTLHLNRATGALYQAGNASRDFNSNRNLGAFQQFGIAMTRVPVWMAAMTAFYGSIRAFRNMVDEILTVDKSLTELKRVASSNINIDTMFQGSVDLSKELGNNLHDIMNAVSDLARTYGHFNERQLLAVSKTAVLMSNVSDLNVEEATQTLVGTMNAFNITAEDSIRIVDSLNEVKVYQPPFTVM